MHPVTPNLWINDGLIDEAVEFYLALFADSEVVNSSTYGPDAGEHAGETMAVQFLLNGQPFTAINGADTRFVPSESVSLGIPCDSQDEIDRLWEALIEGGEPGPCGWLKDRYGFSWQVYPAAMDRMLTDPDPEKVQRVTQCFMKVDKRAFDLAELEAAFQGS